MPSILSERIAALRKERGLTQEQLGKMVGVSSQAVGKWEKGGTPDVELLPILSRQLGVTIDNLFGLDGGEQIDVEDTVRRWIVTVPQRQRLNELCRLVWSAMGPLVLPKGGDYKTAPEFNRESRCEWIDEVDGKSYPILRRTSIFKEDGLVFGVNADDMSFVSIWPERRQAMNRSWRQTICVGSCFKCWPCPTALNCWNICIVSLPTITATIPPGR